ncbi:hypothetical protein [Shewanella fidelis]|uniref:Uncharacterized protein n=1 Tax=Shewanella fidelis TaxID=173509 RepID=A0AAW8NJM2_9GAMM|nr:hypothetical protein [Shewanella fidelis]MDR8523484.1 hypothetical protein [Shewanella fidelis]MDW4813283.1 hypothetical protein [Shewanella fidelis]MDW4817345.1 hypothetical protein [Shewanella fidelis]MDW4821299.1 hypothetical protein [Shewanella fidelis]MDW4824623.1 hypothetical protein [Shewanella fidelis]
MSPVVPEIPIRDGSIGLDTMLAWLEPLPVETRLNAVGYTAKVAHHYQLDWVADKATQQQIVMGWHLGPLHNANTLLPLLIGEGKQQANNVAWDLPALYQQASTVSWLADGVVEVSSLITWSTSDSLYVGTVIAHIKGQPIDTELIFKFASTHHDINQQLAIAWGPHKAQWICSTKYRAPEVGLLTMRFSESAIDSTQRPITLRFTESEKYCYFDDGGGLVDANPSLPTIDFKTSVEPQIRRSYLMQPKIHCERISDGLTIVLKSVTISQSRGQWASSGNMSFSSRIDAERAANELLKISINGYDFYLWCESLSESKSFGQSIYTASGRGRFAELSAPYVKACNYVNTQARSFMGVMADIIENLGWTLASEISDFNVPANAFSYAAKTPAEALNMMANAIGAMLDINNETKTIKVIPQWPTVPWNIAAAIPDVILHDAVIMDFSEKREIRPDANAVFVRGEQQGVAVKVKRSGSAGDNFSADVVDQLITDNQAARMRATAELANAGNKVQNNIRTKVMAELPPMRPGMLIGVRKGTEVYKSVCDSFTINASVNPNSGEVTVNQTVTLLRNEVPI